MAVAKFDDGVPDNPKMIAAGAEACWLWFCGVLYCRRGLTDGFIPKAKVPTLCVGLKHPFQVAARLVDVRLWEDADGGYQVHDFLEWNPSKAKVEDYRRSDRERKHGKNPEKPSERKQAIPNGEHLRKVTIPDDAANARVTHAGAKSESASVKGNLEALELGKESARENPRVLEPEVLPTSDGVQPVWRRSIIDGGEQRAHGQHAFCGKVCVMFRQHLEFIRKLDAPDAGTRLKAWYPTVMAKYEGVPVGEDTFTFWGNEFAAWVGTVTTKPTTQRAARGASNSQAFDDAFAPKELRHARTSERRDALEAGVEVAVHRPSGHRGS